LIAHQQRRAGLSTAAHENAPFILTVDWLDGICYLLDKLEVVILTTLLKTICYTK